MKNKIIIASLCLALSISTVACGSSNNTNIDTSNLSVEEMQDTINELKAENAELKAEIEKLTVKEDTEQVNNELETWDDDYVIAFSDKNLLKEIQKITGVTSRDITYGDVKNITELEISGLSDCSNISTLKYFTGLRELDITGHGSLKDTNLDAIKNLTNLNYLTLFDCRELTDISALANLINLKELTISECDKIENIDALVELQNLEYLAVYSCEGITEDITLGNLHEYINKN